jgi:hypothetical protein
MRLRHWFIFALVSVAIVTAMPARASAPIYQALTYIRNLNDHEFSKLTMWARSGAMKPMVVWSDADRAAGSVSTLPVQQRNAMVQWLSGKGRNGLYALGVRDADIGPRRPGVDIAAIAPAPDPWRPLKFATNTLGASSDSSGIVILNGFGAAKKDGKEILACVSFKNGSTRSAKRIHFTFSITSSNGANLTDFGFDRTGTFSSGVDINSFGSYEEWRSGKTHRGYSQNCKTQTQATASVPVLEARYFSARVTAVDYADGTNWAAPGTP